MSRAMYIDMSEKAVLDKCKAEAIGVSAIEALPSGGVRLVCMSGDGAAVIRRLLKTKLIEGEVTRQRIRPRSPLW
jgi:hypothetical protein